MTSSSSSKVVSAEQTGDQSERRVMKTLTETQQSHNTFLRDRFLRMLTSISHESTVEFTLTNGTHMKCANFVSADVDVLHFQVTSLQTPIGVQPHAILRATDCACFNVSLSNT